MKIQSVVVMMLVASFLGARVGAASPKSEALALLESDLIQQARIQEELDRDSLDSTAVACKYVSSISTPAPLNVVALTFDDGPDATGNAYVRDVLRKYNIPAAFFFVGQKAQQYDTLVQQTIDGGYIVANHSWDHSDFHKISAAAAKSQITRTRDELIWYGEQRYFRYPYGNSTCAANNYAHSLGYKLVGWHVDSCDWAFNATGTVSATNARICEVAPANVSNYVRHVVDSVKAQHGGVVLMHEIQHNTIQHLEEIIETLQAEGFTFGSIADAGFEPCMR